MMASQTTELATSGSPFHAGASSLCMSISTIRAVAYLSGSFTGAFTAVALIAVRRGSWTSGSVLVVAALVAGVVAVGAEERAVQSERNAD